MTIETTLAVTGATGILGGLVAREIAERGIAQRLLVRTLSKAPQLPHATVHPFSYSDQEATRTALDGVSTLFMVSASESADRLDQHRAFIDAAAAAGVEHIVYTSFIAAAPDAVFTLARDHFHTEEYIKASGMRWTFLRNNLYIDFITGPEALTLTEVATVISSVRGKNISFHNETLDKAYASRARYGAPGWQVDAWVSTDAAIASNVMAAISTDAETITGVAPRTLRMFLMQNPA